MQNFVKIPSLITDIDVFSMYFLLYFSTNQQILPYYFLLIILKTTVHKTDVAQTYVAGEAKKDIKIHLKI